MSWLLAPFHYQFMQFAFIAVTLIGICCALLGSYVVLRRMAFIGDAIAHTSLTGIVIAYLESFNLFAGALIAGLLTALGIGWLSKRQALREDTAIGVLFTAIFAAGILIISHTGSYQDFPNMLIGNVQGVTPTDLVLIGIVTALILIFLVLFYKELELTSIDPAYASVIGLRADWMRNLLLVLLSLAVVAGIQAVGVILVLGLLITPAAAASLLTRHLLSMMILSTFIAVSSGIIGLYASFYPRISSGAAIVLTAAAWFAVAFLISHFRQPRRRSS